MKGGLKKGIWIAAILVMCVGLAFFFFDGGRTLGFLGDGEMPDQVGYDGRGWWHRRGHGREEVGHEAVVDLSVFEDWVAETEVSEAQVEEYGVEKCFVADSISEKIRSRMMGKSYPENCSVSMDDLRYLKVLHYDMDGKIHLGEMVCNVKIADDLTEIFKALYDAKYPIGKMVLIDEYDADDEASMRDNNSSSFCFRPISRGSKISMHAYGMAVDINTLYNPYVSTRASGRIIKPSTATPYADREGESPYEIDKDDLCYKLFREHGFSWGGSWRSVKDYQHFEKRL